MEKIPSPKMLDLIVEAFRFELMKYGSFSSTGLAYFGAEVEFAANITLYSRAPREETVTRKVTIGATTELPEDATKTAVEVKAKMIGGRVPPKPPVGAPQGSVILAGNAPDNATAADNAAASRSGR